MHKFTVRICYISVQAFILLLGAGLQILVRTRTNFCESYVTSVAFVLYM